MEIQKVKFILLIFYSYISFLIFSNCQTANSNKTEELDNQHSTDLQKIIQSIINFSNEENTPKQIVSIILTDISQRFDQIIPNLNDSTNLKSIGKIENFKNKLNELKQNFTTEKITNLKEILNEFINDNKEFININSSSEKIIIENFQNFIDSLNSIINELKKLNLKNLDGINYLDIQNTANITKGNMPKECTPDCKCCQDGFCVPDEFCIKENINESNDQKYKEYSGLLLTTPFIIFVAFILLIFAVYVFRKRLFRTYNNDNIRGYNQQHDALEMSNSQM